MPSTYAYDDPIVIILTDFLSATNVRNLWLSAAALLLAEWRVNEQLDPQVLAGASCTEDAVTRLARRYCRAEMTGASELLVQQFESHVAGKLQADREACRYLGRLLGYGGRQYTYLLVLNHRQAQVQPPPLSRLFPRKRQIVIDAVTPKYEDYWRAITDFLHSVDLYPDQCIGVFATYEAIRVADHIGMRTIGHINGQGPGAEELCASAGARWTVRSWVEVIALISKWGYDLPEQLIEQLPPPVRQEPTYLSRFTGPSLSEFNPDPKTYFNRRPSPEHAPWLYPTAKR